MNYDASHYHTKYLALRTLRDLPSWGLSTDFCHWYAYSALPYSRLVQSKGRLLKLGFVYSVKAGVGCELEYKLPVKGSRFLDQLDMIISDNVTAWLTELDEWRSNLPEIKDWRQITLKKLLEPDKY